MNKQPLLWCLLLFQVATVSLFAQQEKPPPSACHVFIDYDFIWTVEVVDGTPILNIITLSEGEWTLRPSQIHLVNSSGREGEVQRFSIETGVAGDPYRTPFLNVLGNSFIGLDLEGEFADFEKPTEVSVDLGDHRYLLQAVDCLDFEMMVEKLNQINFDSPDIREDFAVLKIDPIGRLIPRPRH